MTKELLERRIAAILKEFERLKNDLPADLHDDLPTIADNIRDMMVYGLYYRDRLDQISEYFVDLEPEIEQIVNEKYWDLI